MQVGMTIYDDFMSYGSGVYEYTYGSFAGRHAVVLIGWGHENGELFWICQNSWGPSWGDDGFIKIKAGQIGIDAVAWACDPEV